MARLDHRRGVPRSGSGPSLSHGKTCYPKSPFVVSVRAKLRDGREDPGHEALSNKNCFKLFFSAVPRHSRIDILFPPRAENLVEARNCPRMLIARCKICRNRGIICRPIPANFMALCTTLCAGRSSSPCNFTTPFLATPPLPRNEISFVRFTRLRRVFILNAPNLHVAAQGGRQDEAKIINFASTLPFCLFSFARTSARHAIPLLRHILVACFLFPTRRAIGRGHVRILRGTEKLDVIIPGRDGKLIFLSSEKGEEIHRTVKKHADADPRETVARKVLASPLSERRHCQRGIWITDAQFTSF